MCIFASPFYAFFCSLTRWLSFFGNEWVKLKKIRYICRTKILKSMSDNANFLIDIDRILQQKMGPKARFVPGFLVSYLKRIVHQEELNEFLKRVDGKVGVPFLAECMEFLDATLDVQGEENLPAEGLCTFVSNHPLGGQDGVALGYLLGSHYDGKVKYLVNDLLMNLNGLAPLCIPINKTGKQSRDFPKMVEEGFRSDNHIIMFPAGLCSRRQQGVIKDLPWKKTFVTKSVETHRWVVPIHFEGRNSNFFYNLANTCKRLGLKVNLAMLYLADEMLKNRHKTFRVTIGKPIPWQTFDHSKTAAEWADYVRELVYTL